MEVDTLNKATTPVITYQVNSTADKKVSAPEPQNASNLSIKAEDGKNMIVPNKNVEDQRNDVSDLQGSNELTQEKLRKAIDDINKRMASSTSCEYGYDETTNRVTIKIVDKQTEEVIKEIPPEKTLQMIAKAWELAGILVDEKR